MIRGIEAALFVAGREITEKELSDLLSISENEVKTHLKELRREYETRGSAIEIVKTGKGWAMQVKPEYLEISKKFRPELEISKGALKTLALIAHREPIKQSEVIQIRGNHAYEHIKELSRMDFIKCEKMSRTKILRTTKKFNMYFGISKRTLF